MFFATFLGLTFFHHNGMARPFVHFVGSSAIYPFAVAAADHVYYEQGGPAAVIESTGTGGGIRLFCGGEGDHTPDGVFTSRPLSAGERAYCRKNGVGDVVELTIGYDGLVLAVQQSAPPFPSLKMAALRRAMADSAIKTWHQADRTLPHWPVHVLGPSGNSGTKEAFLHLVMADPKTHRLHAMRTDGAYVNASDGEAIIVQKLMLERRAVALFSYSFLSLSRDSVRPLAIDGVMPTPQTIQDGTYPLHRPFFLVLKKNHLKKIQGVRHLTAAFLSEDALGPHGYLKRYGLIPLKAAGRMAERQKLDLP